MQIARSKMSWFIGFVNVSDGSIIIDGLDICVIFMDFLQICLYVNYHFLCVGFGQFNQMRWCTMKSGEKKKQQQQDRSVYFVIFSDVWNCFVSISYVRNLYTFSPPPLPSNPKIKWSLTWSFVLILMEFPCAYTHKIKRQCAYQLNLP